MSDPETNPAAVPQREDEDDQDLLTYGEVAARLGEEIKAQNTLVTELEKAEPVDAERVERERARLAALRDAQERNSRRPINDENFERFFGYRGTPRYDS
ncbi:acyl-CoA synthase [Frankia sp. AiPs1]|uniref:acyl-CoA synthase n=1 Tax=Frankia sp. AiPs1 TaxID=573493 RepID=UPI002043D73A|nr:acyl-CoA synthase [Frankia sp. AiPs1]MCM3922586.1 acyl-CoA synthase [Frankia sp. AiPs1]